MLVRPGIGLPTSLLGFINEDIGMHGDVSRTRDDDARLVKFMPPKRRFWKDEQKVKSGFSNDFTMVSGPN